MDARSRSRLRDGRTSVVIAALVIAFAAGACHSPPPRQADPSESERLPPPSTSPFASTGGAAEAFALPPDTRPARRPRDQGEGLPAPPDVATAPVDALLSSTGLASKRLQEGTGTTHPGPRDTVNVHYTGWTADGKMFDSSVVRGEPAEFPLDGVIKGWTEGLQLMVVGEKRRFWIPAALAYGSQPRAGAPSGQLTFDVELFGVTPKPPPPPVPLDVTGPPASAKKTASGLRYRVIRAGNAGGGSPTSKSKVTVHYSGWSTGGVMFDSTSNQGKPATFPLEAVIKGWSEGVQLMKRGDVFRFWIPGKLAYGDKATRPGIPAGTLVFEIELLDFEP